MNVVFADSPSAAYAQAASRDQERVQNFLRSFEMNQSRKQAGWENAYRVAAAQQAAQQNEQGQAIRLTDILNRNQLYEQGRQDTKQRDLIDLMLANRNYQLRKDELTRPDPRLLAQREQQKLDAAELSKQDALEAASLTRQALASLAPAQEAFKQSGVALERAGESGGPRSMTTAMDMLRLLFNPNAAPRTPTDIDPQLNARMESRMAIQKAFGAAADRLLQQNKAQGRFVVDPQKFTITPLDPGSAPQPFLPSRPISAPIDVQSTVRSTPAVAPNVPQFNRGQRVVQNGVVYTFDGQQFIAQ